ncbi:MAG: PilN domain-containing protein [Candidatus Komeilibacteria bacterium]
MVDFLQNKKEEKREEKKPKVKKQGSFLRSLLHPVNGKKDGESIDLLAVAKEQMADLPKEDIKEPIIQEVKVKKEKLKKEPILKKKLEEGGSEKVRKGFDVNLLPATFRFRSTNKLISMMSVWLIVTIIILVGIFTVISFYGLKVTEEGLALEVEIEELDKEIAKYSGDLNDAESWQLKLSAVDSLLRSHVYWTNFFDVLEKTTLPEVYYSGFTASLVNSDINLASYAKSFTTVAEQLIAYERFPEIFGGFSVAEASLDEGIGISYNALVNLYRDVFYDQNFVEKK